MRLTPGTGSRIAARQRTGCERTFGSNPALLPKLGLVGRPGFWRRPRIRAAAFPPTEGDPHSASPWSSTFAYPAAPVWAPGRGTRANRGERWRNWPSDTKCSFRSLSVAGRMDDLSP